MILKNDWKVFLRNDYILKKGGAGGSEPAFRQGGSEERTHWPLSRGSRTIGKPRAARGATALRDGYR